jgi:DNA-binding SARP family transcriptional activator
MVAKDHKKEFLERLNSFIDLIPNNFHLILIDREKSSLSKLPYWKIHTNLLEIKTEDYQLNKSQINDLFKSQFKLNLDAAEIEKVYSFSEGWLLGINHLAKQLQADNKLDIILDLNSGFLKPLFSYFDYELNNLNFQKRKQLKELLFKTSIFEIVDLEATSNLLEENDFKFYFEEMVAKNFFVNKISRHTYRFHNVFHTYLYYKAEQNYDLEILISKTEKYFNLKLDNNKLAVQGENLSFFSNINKMEADHQNDVSESDYYQANNLKDEIKESDYNEIDKDSCCLLKIKTLGKFELYRGKVKIEESDWPRTKAKELFYLLLLKKYQMLEREKITSILWPEKDPKAANQNFYVNLNCLNKVLKPDKSAAEESCFIKSVEGSYGLENDKSFSYDVNIFENLIEKAQKNDDQNLKFKYLMQAVDIYDGQYLSGVIANDLIIRERERLEIKFIAICEDLIEILFERKNYDEVINLSDKVLIINSYIEFAYLYKMKAYQDLGIDPGCKIETYYKQLK